MVDEFPDSDPDMSSNDMFAGTSLPLTYVIPQDGGLTSGTASCGYGFSPQSSTVDATTPDAFNDDIDADPLPFKVDMMLKQAALRQDGSPLDATALAPHPLSFIALNSLQQLWNMLDLRYPVKLVKSNLNNPGINGMFDCMMSSSGSHQRTASTTGSGRRSQEMLQETYLSSAIWKVLQLLPTNVQSLKKLRNLRPETNAGLWVELLDAKNTYKLLYNLQIVDAFHHHGAVLRNAAWKHQLKVFAKPPCLPSSATISHLPL
jgi:hypothetical protein